MTNYRLNEEKMFADIADGIAIIINNETGIYYGMNGFGTSVFENLMKGASTQDILEKLKQIPNVSPHIEVNFKAFMDAIIEKEYSDPQKLDQNIFFLREDFHRLFL